VILVVARTVLVLPLQVVRVAKLAVEESEREHEVQ
jgi:hypothetical protein